MNDIPLWTQLAGLGVLILLSAFFSIAETSMMALNRYRLRALARQGRRGAVLAARMLERTEKLLGMILIGNNLVNAAASALVTAIAITRFGNDDLVLFLATTLIAFLIIVFAEITPKVIGATFPEAIALRLAFVLQPLARLFTPAVWFVNLFTGLLLKPFRIGGRAAGADRLSQEELRLLVLENGQFIPKKHQSVLLNLLGLDAVTVRDVMTPRPQVEALDLGDPIEVILGQLSTCYHNKLPVYDGEINNVRGILHVRKCLALLADGGLTHDGVRASLSEAYFIPAGTPVMQQLQYFQENRQRLGIVVDEYGEMVGLVTLEDIIEELIGEFTTSMPRGEAGLAWDAQGQATVDGATPLRELNRRLGLQLPLDGPTTLNGLILEVLQDIPETNLSLRIGACAIEIVQVDHQAVRVARIIRLDRPDSAAGGPAAAAGGPGVGADATRPS